MNKKTCIIASPFATRSGYGDHSRDIIRSILTLKSDVWDVKLLSLPWGNCPMNALQDKTDSDLIDRMVIDTKNITQPDIWIQITIPSEFVPNGKYLNIGITAGIETTSFHPKWIQGCNLMDVIILPSEHSKHILENTTYKYKDKAGNEQILKFEKTANVLFEGLDTEVYGKTNEIDLTIKDTLSQVKESFAFLFVGHWMEGKFGEDRKDVGGMITTFVESFKRKREKPALILKTSGATFSEIDLDNIRKKIKALSKNSGVSIYLIHGDLTSSEMNSLYNHPKIKAMISFSKGEGYGRPLLEFAASGKPVIASNWSGQLQFLSKDYSELLGGKLTPVDASAFNKEYMGEDSKWFTVNYNDAKDVLKDVYKNYKTYLAKSKKGISYYNSFSMDKMNEKFGKLLEEYEIPDQLSSEDIVLPD